MPLESSVLSKISIMNSLVISASLMAEKQNFFPPRRQNFFYDADCADMSRYDNTELARTNQNQFCTLVYLSIDKHNNPRTRE